MKFNKIFISISLSTILVTNPVYANEYSYTRLKETGKQAVLDNLNNSSFNLTKEEIQALKYAEDFKFGDQYDEKYQKHVDALDGISIGKTSLQQLATATAKYERLYNFDIKNTTNAVLKVSEVSDIPIDFNKHFLEKNSHQYNEVTANWSVIEQSLESKGEEINSIVNRRDSLGKIFIDSFVAEGKRLGRVLDFGLSASKALGDYTLGGVKYLKNVKYIKNSDKLSKIKDSAEILNVLTNLTSSVVSTAQLIGNPDYNNSINASGDISGLTKAMEDAKILGKALPSGAAGSAKALEAIKDFDTANKKFEELSKLRKTGNSHIDQYVELAKKKTVVDMTRSAFALGSGLGSFFGLDNYVDSVDKAVNLFATVPLDNVEDKLEALDEKYTDINFIYTDIVTSVIASQNQLNIEVGNKILNEELRPLDALGVNAEQGSFDKVLQEWAWRNPCQSGMSGLTCSPEGLQKEIEEDVKYRLQLLKEYDPNLYTRWALDNPCQSGIAECSAERIKSEAKLDKQYDTDWVLANPCLSGLMQCSSDQIAKERQKQEEIPELNSAPEQPSLQQNLAHDLMCSATSYQTSSIGGCASTIGARKAQDTTSTQADNSKLVANDSTKLTTAAEQSTLINDVTIAAGDWTVTQGDATKHLSIGDSFGSITAPTGGQIAGLNNADIPVAVMERTFTVPNGVRNVNTSLLANFVTNEFPEYVGTEFNDNVRVEVITGSGNSYNIDTPFRQELNSADLSAVSGLPMPMDATGGQTGFIPVDVNNIPVAGGGEITIRVTSENVGDDLYPSAVLINDTSVATK